MLSKSQFAHLLHGSHCNIGMHLELLVRLPQPGNSHWCCCKQIVSRILTQDCSPHTHFVPHLQANVEETEMERLHGEQYSEYSSRVSKLIPGIF